MYSEDDLDAMMDAIGTVSVTFTFSGVPVKTVPAIFRRRLAAGSPYDFQEPARHALQIRCKSSDVADITQENSVTIDGEYYQMIGNPVPFNSGFSTIEIVESR